MSDAAPWLEADWPAPPGVRAFTTLRHGAGVSEAPFDRFNLGVRCGDDPACAQANRELLVELADLPSPPRWLRQVHGTRVLRFDSGTSDDPVDGAARLHSLPASPFVDGERGGEERTPPAGDERAGGGDRIPGEAPEADADGLAPPLAHRAGGDWEGVASAHDDEPEADAAVTGGHGVVLAIQTADCLPVLFCSDDGLEVAGAHAGWRGLLDGVLEATVAAMRTPPQRLQAWLGPAAGPGAYEVGLEVYDAFVSRDWSAGVAFSDTRPHHWNLDLYALARQRLASIGITPARVSGGGLCTISDPARFFSHRRDRRTGRMATLIWIE